MWVHTDPHLITCIIKCRNFCQFSGYKIYLCGLYLLLSCYFKHWFYFILPLFSFWHSIIYLFVTPLRPGKARCMLEVHASGTLCFGMSSLKFSKSISVATRQNAQSLEVGPARTLVLFLPFVALSYPLHHLWVNQIPQVAPELLLMWLFLDPMPGAQFKRTAHWIICSCCNISFVGCQNGTDFYTAHGTHSGFWATNGPVPMYVDEGICSHQLLI